MKGRSIVTIIVSAVLGASGVVFTALFVFKRFEKSNDNSKQTQRPITQSNDSSPAIPAYVTKVRDLSSPLNVNDEAKWLSNLPQEQRIALQKKDEMDLSKIQMAQSQMSRELDRLAALPQSLRIQTELGELSTLPTLVAVRDGIELPEAKLWKKTYGYSIFSFPRATELPENGFGVVRINGTNRIGIVTGGLTITGKSISIDELVAKYPLQHVQTFPDIHTAVFKIQDKSLEKIARIVADIRSHEKVQQAEIQIVERIYVSR